MQRFTRISNGDQSHDHPNPTQPQRPRILTSGDITRNDIIRIFVERILDKTVEIDLLAEELLHLPFLLRMVHALERITLVADADWISTAAKIEANPIPGVTYEVYNRRDKAHARGWLLRETDTARPPA